MLKKTYTLSFLVFLVIVLFPTYNIFWRAKPGRKIAELARNHVPEGTRVDYNSNPPTSGPHYESFYPAGFYEEILTDEKLVHNLEHGFVIVSYNCGFNESKKLFDYKIYAHEEGEASKDDSDSNPDHLIIDSWKKDPACGDLIRNLENLGKKMKFWKLIVAARANLDARIALTAWGRLDKFTDFEEKRIVSFVKNFRDYGPEDTAD